MSRLLSQYKGAGGFNSSTSVDVLRLGGKSGAQADYLHDLRKLRRHTSSATQHGDISQRKLPPKSKSTLLAILSNLREHSIRAKIKKGRARDRRS